MHFIKTLFFNNIQQACNKIKVGTFNNNNSHIKSCSLVCSQSRYAFRLQLAVKELWFNRKKCFF